MKTKDIVIFLALILLACNRNNTNRGAESTITMQTKQQVMSIALDYVRVKFNDSEENVLADGKVKIGDNQLTYIADPKEIVLGLIDNDENEDAIITISSQKGKFRSKTEQLILISTGGKLVLSQVISDNMKIIGLKDRIVTGEISKFPPDSPNVDCPICQEIVKYHFKDDKLVKIN